jgi:uncharacterized damage-inducible protein DinB
MKSWTDSSIKLATLTATHTRHLRTLAGEALDPVISSTSSKAIMLAAIQAAEIEMLQTIALVPVSVRNKQRVCGFWTLQDLLGHLADWDTYFLNWLAALTGEPQQDLYWDNDGDAFNAWLYKRRRGESLGKAWGDFRRNREMLYERLAIIPEKQFMRKKVGPFPSVYHCAWSALEHYMDHAAGIRRELKLPIAEELLTFHGPYTD